jgi:Pentapeptide repeats (8 copies)
LNTIGYYATHFKELKVVQWPGAGRPGGPRKFSSLPERVILCGMRTSRLVLLSIGVVALLVALWWYLPPYLVDSEIMRHGTLDQIAAVEPDKYALVVDEYRKTLSQTIGGFGFVGALLISVMTLRANERAKLTERFGKALDHLGAVRSEDAKVASEVRIGAVSELEGIGEESPRELRMIRSSFVAYLRNYAHWRSAWENKHSPAMWRIKETQAMMSVLGRWGFPAETKDETQLADLDLRHLHLLPQANLANVIAARSRFDYASLKRVSFRNADLTRTVFSGAELGGVDFRGANLFQCKFVGNDSTETEHVWGWNYDEKRFRWGGHSSDAKLHSADMSGVDLSSTIMTEEQFKSIITDADTKPPQSFRSPATHKT